MSAQSLPRQYGALPRTPSSMQNFPGQTILQDPFVGNSAPLASNTNGYRPPASLGASPLALHNSQTNGYANFDSNITNNTGNGNVNGNGNALSNHAMRAGYRLQFPNQWLPALARRSGDVAGPLLPTIQPTASTNSHMQVRTPSQSPILNQGQSHNQGQGDHAQSSNEAQQAARFDETPEKKYNPFQEHHGYHRY